MTAKTAPVIAVVCGLIEVDDDISQKTAVANATQ